MENLQNSVPQEEYSISVKLIAFLVTSVVVILVAIFFIRTYEAEKQDIIWTMHKEGKAMEDFYSENLNQTWYVINLLSNQIKKDPHNLIYVKDLLKDYISEADVKEIFGWDEFIWFDHSLQKRVSSNGTIDKAFSPMLTKKMAFKHQFSEKISYWFNAQNKSMYAVVGLFDDKTNKYIGSVTVYFDLPVLMRHLDSRKVRESTAFALIGENLQVVAQSHPEMEDIGLKNGEVVERHLVRYINRIDLESENNNAYTFLDVISGVNYYLQKLQDQPFVLLVNMDHKDIRGDIFAKITVKFLETSVVAAFILMLIIVIYRRETRLRAKAELASEVAKRAAKAKTDFLAFTAHEIRSPLGFIMTGSEMMQQRLMGDVDERYDEYLEGIHQNGSLILDFITDILDEAQVLEGNFKIVNREAKIKDIIVRAVSVNAAKFHNSKIDVNIDPDLPLLICDARRILQVMSNLISNAIKYSYPGTVVEIKAKMDNEELCVIIKDQGAGMTEEEIVVAFTKYGTVRKKDFDFIEAYGLGLPIVKMLLDAHSARIVIKSEANVGTTISVLFPQEKLVTKALKSTTKPKNH